MAAGLFVVGRMEGIERPALSLQCQLLMEKGFVMLDVGANVDAKPIHLYQYAVMGSYAEKVRGIKNPRVGLLNVGTEDGKGTSFSNKSLQCLKMHHQFVGNVESKETCYKV